MLSKEQRTALAKIAAAAVACEKITGCPAALSAAQCIFESSWLTRAPGNNCFGIKADHRGSGQQYIVTHEFINGEWQTMALAFESYASIEDCFADHARLIQESVYAQAWQKYATDHDLDAYIAGVAAHYATDPTYRQKIIDEAHSNTVTEAIAKARS